MKSLNEFWQIRRAVARSVAKAHRQRTETAVKNLYQALSRPEPILFWIKDPNDIRGRLIADDLRLDGLVEMLFLWAWHKSPDPEQLTIPLGYNHDTASFRMSDNHSTAFKNARLRGVRRSRPRWLREMTNFVTQFDAASIALWQYSNQSSSDDMAKIGLAIVELLNETFGIIAFTNTCLIIDRPQSITFDDTDLLSSTPTPALRWRDGAEVYVVNGVLVPEIGLKRVRDHLTRGIKPSKNPRTYYDNPLWWYLADLRDASERVAVIEILGWDKFLEIVPNDNMTLVANDSKYGDLWHVDCGRQTLMLLQVTNHSPEPDGTFKKFVIPVDPMLRPLPNPRDPNGTMGIPQNLTALNAVASTFGMTGQQYAEVLGEQS